MIWTDASNKWLVLVLQIKAQEIYQIFDQGVGVVIFLAIKRGGIYSKHDT